MRDKVSEMTWTNQLNRSPSDNESPCPSPSRPYFPMESSWPYGTPDLASPTLAKTKYRCSASRALACRLSNTTPTERREQDDRWISGTGCVQLVVF